MFYKNGASTRYYRSFFHEEQSHFCRPLCGHIVIYVFILRFAVSLPSDKELVLYHPFIKSYFSNLISVLGDKFRKISYENIGRRTCNTFREYYGWLCFLYDRLLLLFLFLHFQCKSLIFLVLVRPCTGGFGRIIKIWEFGLK